MSARSSGTDAFTIPWIRLDATYEGALVFNVPDTIHAAVEEDRRIVGRPNGVRERPHVTLLYLNYTSGWRLLQLQERLIELEDETLTVRATGVGTFEDTGRIVNAHVRLERNDALVAAHDRALALARSLDGFDPGPFCGSRFTPHLSVFRRIAWPVADRRLLARMGPWDGRSIALLNLHVMADPVVELTSNDTAS